MNYSIRLFQFNASGNIMLFADARQLQIDADLLASLIFEWLSDNLKATNYIKAEILGILTHSEECCAKINFWNPDGTQERVCGNALRCLPLIFNYSGTALSEYSVETQQGNFRIGTFENEYWVEFDKEHILSQCIKQNQWIVDCGTPHLVFQVDDIASLPSIQNARIRSEGFASCNVTNWCFDGKILNVRTFERSVGETASCGTGALSAYFVFSKVYPRIIQPIILNFFAGGHLKASKLKTGAIRIQGPCSLINTDIIEVKNSEKKFTELSIIIVCQSKAEIIKSLHNLIKLITEVNAEIIVVYLGSKYGELYEQIQITENQVKIVNASGIGPNNKYNGRNIGALFSTKRFLFFYDSDSNFSPFLLSSLIQQVKKTKNSFGIITQVTRRNKKNAENTDYITTCRKEFVFKTIDGTVLRINEGNVVLMEEGQATELLLVLRSDFERIGGYNAMLGGWEAQDLFCRLILGIKLKALKRSFEAEALNNERALTQLSLKKKKRSQIAEIRKAISNYNKSRFLGSCYLLAGNYKNS